MACRKRKVDSECRLFKEEWAWKYFFTEYNGKPICLICNEAVAVFKEFNVARHFNSKHAKTKYAAECGKLKKKPIWSTEHVHNGTCS